MTTSKKSRILIVDDHPTNLKVLSDLLIAYGFEVLIAKNGSSALQKLQRVIPDLILLDVLMPVLDGFEICQQLKASEVTRDIPVIFMTALTDPIDKIRGLSIGAVDYITKPIQHEEVLARINVHLRLSHLSKQLEEQNHLLQDEIRSRELVQSALRTSEIKFSKAFRSNPGAMMITTLEDHRFLEINQSFCTLTGYLPEEVLGKTADELNLWKNSAERDRFHDRPPSGTFKNQEFQVQGKSGEIKFVLISSEIIELEGAQCLLAMAQDITETKRSSLALLEKEQFLRGIYEGVEQSIWVIDIQADGDFALAGANPVCERLAGFKPGEIKNKTIGEIFPPDAAAAIRENYRTCIERGTSRTYEECLPFQGQQRWTLTTLTPLRDERSQIYRIIGTATDITKRKHAELALAEREAMLSSIGDNLPKGMIYQVVRELDETYHFSYVSAGIEQISGLKPQAVLENAQIFYDQFLADDLARLKQTIESSMQNLSVFDAQVRRLNSRGEWRWSHFRSAPRRLDDGRMIWDGIELDITDLKQAEEALQRSEAKLNDILNSAGAAIASFRILPDQSWQFDYRSAGATTVFGYTVEEYLHNPDRWATRLKERSRVLAQVHQVIFSGRPGTVEYEFYHKDHSLRWISSTYTSRYDDSTQGWVVTVVSVDITDRVRIEDERKQTEAALQASEERLQLVLNANNDGIWDVNLITNHRFCSQRWYDMLGYTEAEIGPDNDNFFALIHADDLESFLAANQAYLEQKLPHYSNEYRVLCKDGTYKWCESRGTALWDQQGKPVRMTGSMRDVTERKQRAAELQQAKEAAETANLAKSAFLANMNHELRTPLAIILGCSELLESDKTITPKQRSRLTTIDRSVQHLLNLINNVLELSKIEAGAASLSLVEVNLPRLLENVVEMFRLPVASKGLRFVYDRHPNLPNLVETDENKLRQVLMNLLGNAIKFTDSPAHDSAHCGSITLRASCLDCSDSTDSPSITLRFEVADTGPGIAPQELDSVFDAFVQTETGRKSNKGTGLGLAISRQFVELMGGHISVSSTIGHGTQFTVDLPVTPIWFPTLVPQLPQVIGLQPHQETYRILVVEDTEDARSLLVQLLSDRGFDVQSVADGQQAIDHWQHWHPHLILMDQRMPEMDGYEATQQIRQLEHQQQKTVKKRRKSSTPLLSTKIIALTASAFEDDRGTRLAIGCDDVLYKPFREDQLLSTIARHLKVLYVYDEAQPTDHHAHQLEAVDASAQTIATAFETLQTAMPGEWVADLYGAASRLNVDRCLTLIQQLPDDYLDLSHALCDAVNNFRFDVVISLTQSVQDFHFQSH